MIRMNDSNQNYYQNKMNREFLEYFIIIMRKIRRIFWKFCIKNITIEKNFVFQVMFNMHVT